MHEDCAENAHPRKSIRAVMKDLGHRVRHQDPARQRRLNCITQCSPSEIIIEALSPVSNRSMQVKHDAARSAAFVQSLCAIRERLSRRLASRTADRLARACSTSDAPQYSPSLRKYIKIQIDRREPLPIVIEIPRHALERIESTPPWETCRAAYSRRWCARRRPAYSLRRGRWIRRRRHPGPATGRRR